MLEEQLESHEQYSHFTDEKPPFTELLFVKVH